MGKLAAFAVISFLLLFVAVVVLIVKLGSNKKVEPVVPKESGLDVRRKMVNAIFCDKGKNGSDITTLDVYRCLNKYEGFEDKFLSSCTAKVYLADNSTTFEKMRISFCDTNFTVTGWTQSSQHVEYISCMKKESGLRKDVCASKDKDDVKKCNKKLEKQYECMEKKLQIQNNKNSSGGAVIKIKGKVKKSVKKAMKKAAQ